MNGARVKLWNFFLTINFTHRVVVTILSQNYNQIISSNISSNISSRIRRNRE